MDTESLRVMYQKSLKAKGVTKHSSPVVQASQSTTFGGWEVKFEVSSSTGIEWHTVTIYWHSTKLIFVGGKSHAEVVRLAKEHVKRLEGYSAMLVFVTSLDHSYQPE